MTSPVSAERLRPFISLAPTFFVAMPSGRAAALVEIAASRTDLTPNEQALAAEFQEWADLAVDLEENPDNGITLVVGENTFDLIEDEDEEEEDQPQGLDVDLSLDEIQNLRQILEKSHGVDLAKYPDFDGLQDEIADAISYWENNLRPFSAVRVDAGGVGVAV